MLHHHQRDQVVFKGKPLAEAQKVLIMIHGRGAQPESILSLAPHLELENFALVAPAADQYTWYPNSFMAPIQSNQPGLDSAISLLDGLMDEILAAGFDQSQIYLLGFSQGACLSLDFAARRGGKWGGVVVLSGGLIGDQLYLDHYPHSLDGTPIFIGCSDHDAHVPESRVLESEAQVKLMGAEVTATIYPGMGHTIIQEEIDLANRILSA